jgi:hypothetical protein
VDTIYCLAENTFFLGWVTHFDPVEVIIETLICITVKAIPGNHTWISGFDYMSYNQTLPHGNVVKYVKIKRNCPFIQFLNIPYT